MDARNNNKAGTYGTSAEKENQDHIELTLQSKPRDFSLKLQTSPRQSTLSMAVAFRESV
jgi:hypothetical protein